MKVEITPYHILDIMRDPAYYKHFLYRFQITRDRVDNRCIFPNWLVTYRDKPKDLLKHAIKHIENVLKDKKDRKKAGGK